MTDLTPAEKVAAYIYLRDHKKAAEDEFKKSLERTTQAMEKLEGELLQHLQETGAQSLACEAGTVYRNTQLNATVENRDDFLKFINKHKAWEALDVKANKTFVREYMEEHGDVIPGVKVTQRATVGVRRS